MLDDNYTLFKWFIDYENNKYDTMLIEYKTENIYIKLQPDNTLSKPDKKFKDFSSIEYDKLYTFMNNDLIIVDLLRENIIDFLLSNNSRDYKSIFIYNR